MSRNVARIDFLGTGNAFCPSGRMHALAILDEKILIDAPPTLLAQLRRSDISTNQVEHVLFTHWHGDHAFGFPFLILDRKYISDPSGDKILSVHHRPGGKKYLASLSRLGFPGSLEDFLESRILWNEEESGILDGSEWKYHRFPVLHTPETDPHGYELVHQSGFRLLHCGDSGPCSEIESRAGSADVVLLEMGMPDIGDFPHHHRPSDVVAFSQRFPETRVLVTHNYAKSPDSEFGFDIPELPEQVVQLNDGASIIVHENGNFSVNNSN
tara:strand:- start:19 stop:825 length:807 start_codon:yes stop_codon:yes gene_type:complete